jgi:hypothetical protein
VTSLHSVQQVPVVERWHRRQAQQTRRQRLASLAKPRPT